jgi:hypothetical protein
MVILQNTKETQSALLAELARENVQVAKGALKPLQELDFTKLVSIHDHEERYLRLMLVSNLVSISRVRSHAYGGTPEVSEADVRTALRMLGVAVQGAPEEAISKANRKLLILYCPYCPKASRNATA